MAVRMQPERRRNDCFYSLYGCKSNQCEKKKIFITPHKYYSVTMVTLYY
ncbi:unnamed protein product [Staurois parvus]|uniref:Uncharacterized protein n=1 Tax=Staurois parvus TaxID=386267 RepID=A0ABN9BH99_9NEOB|nr:unnamed protein product [Staurois parvus]